MTILTFIFTLISFNVFALDKSSTFSNEVFKKAQAEGKTVVINSWNKTCSTCAKQVIILDEAKKNNSLLPITEIVDQYYGDVQKLGGNRWDTSSLIRRLRK